MTTASSTDETPAPRRRPGGRTARTGAAVLAATLEILAEDGFAALTIDAVAEKAGVHRTTLYRRWGTRERLVVDALASQSTTEIPIPDTGTIQSDTEAIAEMVSANLASPLGRALAQGMVGHGEDDEIRSVTEEFWRTRFERPTSSSTAPSSGASYPRTPTPDWSSRSSSPRSGSAPSSPAPRSTTR